MTWTRNGSIALVLLLPLVALADDVVVQPSAGDAFVIRDNTGASERLRVDEATGDVSRDGLLFLHTRGNTSMFIGTNSGASNTGALNVALGHSALTSVTTGNLNTTVGAGSLTNTTTGSSNSAVGFGTLQQNVSGSDNSAFGAGALFNNTASGNTAIGASASSANLSGTNNVAVGNRALLANLHGTWNTAVGTHALELMSSPQGQSASFNTAIGAYALAELTTSNSNTAIGTGALAVLATGEGNVAIGNLAGGALSSGSRNIYLGSDGGTSESNTIRIGRTSAPTPHTQTFIGGIHGNVVSGGSPVIVNSAGDIGTIASSRRYKRDITALDVEDSRIRRLRPVSFRYRDEYVGEGDPALEYGLVAEEVAEIAPELVVLDDDGRAQSVRYHLLTPMLIAEVQRQQRVIEDQARSVASLAADVERLRALLSERTAPEN